MYGRLNQRKLRQDDYIMSCQKARAELDSYIDQEARRVNIDSAKKRAVLQHMDYEGFRQMVLGANIFPTKSLQLQKFSKGENTQTVQNKLYNNQGQQNSEQVHKYKASQHLLRSVQGKSQLECNSFRQFKKKFNEFYPPNGELDTVKGQQLYNLIKYQNETRIMKIFNMQCEASILVKMVNVFEFIINYLRQSDNQGKVVKEVVFMIKLLEMILTLKNMREFNLTVLSKKQRNKIVDFLLSTKQFIVSSSNNINKEKRVCQEKKSQDQKEQTKKSEDEKIIDSLVLILSKK